MYRGSSFIFEVYTINTENATYTLKDTLDLVEELGKLNKLEQRIDEFDVITDLRILNDGGRTLRIY